MIEQTLVDAGITPAIQDADVAHVKYKAIELYSRWIHRLYKGHKDDYSTIMNMINFVSLPRDFSKDKQIFEYLINIRP